MTNIEQNIVLRWISDEASANPSTTWYLRGIRPDGSFYGELKTTQPNGSTGVSNIEGQLKQEDNLLLRKLLGMLNEEVGNLELHDGNYDGLLAWGTVSQPHILFKYSHGVHKNEKSGEVFLGIINVVAPYMQQAD